jgi:predicted aspartyl protease
MNVPFKAQQGLIIVPAVVLGPVASGFVQLALDTGATDTLINADILLSIGVPTSGTSLVPVTTGSGIERVPQVTLPAITALGQQRQNFPVICHTLPPTAGVDGLLGLDFFRGLTLIVDFRTEQISLS